VGGLAMASPLFPAARLHLGNGRTLTIIGSHAPDPFVQRAVLSLGSGGGAGSSAEAATASASTWNQPWLPPEALVRGATLSVSLGPHANEHWGTTASAVPPSFSQGAAPAVGFTSPGGALTMRADSAASLALGIQQSMQPSRGVSRATADHAATVTWHVVAQPGVLGVHVSPASGTFSVHGRATTPLLVASGSPGAFSITFILSADGVALPKLVIDVQVTP
jgi:hypothetical protein